MAEVLRAGESCGWGSGGEFAVELFDGGGWVVGLEAVLEHGLACGGDEVEVGDAVHESGGFLLKG